LLAGHAPDRGDAGIIISGHHQFTFGGAAVTVAA